MRILKIHNWDRFQPGKSKFTVVCRWVAVPTDLDSPKYELMVAERVKGCFVSMAQHLATKVPPREGYLTHNCRSDGIPLTPEQLSRQTFYPVDVVKHTIETALAVGWLEEETSVKSTTREIVRKPCAKLAQTVRINSEICAKKAPARERKGRERKGKERNIKKAGKPADTYRADVKEALEWQREMIAWAHDHYAVEIRDMVIKGRIEPNVVVPAFRITDTKIRQYTARRNDGHSRDDVLAAFFGNACNPWHLARSKHDWELILRVGKFDKFKTAGEKEKFDYERIKKWIDDKRAGDTVQGDLGVALPNQ